MPEGDEDDDLPTCYCSQEPLTVADLIAELQKHPPDMHVIGRYDGGCGQGYFTVTTGHDWEWPESDEHVILNLDGGW